jgi:hypothetical protein
MNSDDNNLDDILVYAWNKDAVNLKSALDVEMQSRVTSAMDNMVADVSASLFNATTGMDNPPSTNANEG